MERGKKLEYEYTSEELDKMTNKFNKMMETHKIIDGIDEGILIVLNKDTGFTIENTRPLFLINDERKILCHIILNRIDKKINEYLTKNQNGFPASRSDIAIAYAAQFKLTSEIYERGFEMEKTDMSENYNELDRNLLLKILEEEVQLDIDGLRLVRVMIANLKLRMKVGNMFGKYFPTSVGMPQCMGLSPKLFLVYIEYISRRFKRESDRQAKTWDLKLSYADDFAYFFIAGGAQKL